MAVAKACPIIIDPMRSKNQPMRWLTTGVATGDLTGGTVRMYASATVGDIVPNNAYISLDHMDAWSSGNPGSATFEFAPGDVHPESPGVDMIYSRFLSFNAGGYNWRIRADYQCLLPKFLYRTVPGNVMGAQVYFETNTNLQLYYFSAGGFIYVDWEGQAFRFY